MIDISTLKDVAGFKEFKEGEVIFKENEMLNRNMYIIIKGDVGIFFKYTSIAPIKINELSAGEIFGEMSMFNPLMRTATAVASNDVVLLPINKENFEQVISKNPQVATEIIRVIGARLYRFHNKMPDEMKKSEQINPQFDYKKVAQTGFDRMLNVSEEEYERIVLNKKEEVDEHEENYGDNLIITNKELLFPKEQKTYGIPQPENANRYIIDDKVECPVCGGKFDVKFQLTSRLRLRETTHALRKIFDDFEPMWYNIWTCPHCLYSNFYYDYANVTVSEGEAIKDYMKGYKSKIKVTTGENRTVDEVFAMYYLALKSAEAYSAPLANFSKLWIQLSWLYEDCGDEKLHKMATEQALKYYEQFRYESTKLSDEEEQRLCLVLAELKVQTGDYNGAIELLFAAKSNKEGTRFLQQKADRRLSEIREIARALKNQ